MKKYIFSFLIRIRVRKCDEEKNVDIKQVILLGFLRFKISFRKKEKEIYVNKESYIFYMTFVT